MPRISFDRKFLLAWTVSLGIVGAVALLGYRSSVELQTSNQRIQEVFRVREALADVTASVLAMESAARGFVISSKPGHLDAYADAGHRLVGARSRLEAAGPDLELSGLWSMVDAKVTHMDEMLALVGHHPDVLARSVEAGQGRLRMREIRDEVSRLTVVLNRELQSRRQYAAKSCGTTWPFPWP